MEQLYLNGNRKQIVKQIIESDRNNVDVIFNELLRLMVWNNTKLVQLDIAKNWLNWYVAVYAQRYTLEESSGEDAEVEVENCLKSKPKGICAYEFKPGDIAWNCKQCQVDDTCVLCNECFMNSNHEGHEVFFYYTLNGGCCDCGDHEAWSEDGFCKYHSGKKCAPVVHQALAEGFEKIVVGVCEKLTNVMNVVYRGYQTDPGNDIVGKVDIVIHGNDLETSQDFLFNVERSSDIVENPNAVLHQVCEQGQCSVLSRNNIREAIEIRQRLQQDGFIVSILPGSWEIEINNVLPNLHWMTNMASMSDACCRRIAQELTQDGQDEQYGLLKLYIVADALLPKQIVQALHSLFMALLADSTFKKGFAIAFALGYASVYRDYIRGIGTSQNTVLAFGVQFLNRASFVLLLVQEYHLFDVILHSLWESLVSASKNTMEKAESLLWSKINEFQDWNAVVAMPSFVHSIPTLMEIANALQNIDIQCLSQQQTYLATTSVLVHALSPKQGILEIQDYSRKVNTVYDQIMFFRERWMHFVPNDSNEVALANALNKAMPVMHIVKDIAHQRLPTSFGHVLRHGIFVHRRYLNSIMDLRYVLQIDGSIAVFNSSNFANRSIFETLIPDHPFAKCLRIESCLQGIFFSHCQQGQHVSYENREWLYAVDLVVTMGDICPGILQRLLPASTAQLKQAEIYQAICAAGLPIFQEFKFWVQCIINSQPSSLVYASDTTQPCEYDILLLGVSSHYPLHRCIGQFFKECIALGDVVSSFVTFVRCQLTGDGHDLTNFRASMGFKYWLALFEFPLRAIVHNAQVFAGIWVRNGQSMRHHAANYTELPLCSRMRDLDLVVLQLVFLCIEPKLLLESIVSRYGLSNCWFSTSYPSSTPIHSPYSASQIISMAEACLTLICQITSEIPSTMETINICIRRDLAHRLMAGKCAHSDLAKITQDYARKGYAVPHETLNSILSTIAVVPENNSESESASHGLYKLLPDLYQEYDPTYFHLSSVEHEAVRQKWIQYRKFSKEKALPAVPPPLAIRPEMTALRLMLFDKVVHFMIMDTLQICWNHIGRLDPNGKDKYSDTLLSRVMQLVCLQIHNLKAIKNCDVQSFVQFPKTLDKPRDFTLEYEEQLVLVRGKDSILGLIVRLHLMILRGNIATPGDSDLVYGHGKSLSWIVEQLKMLSNTLERAISSLFEADSAVTNNVEDSIAQQRLERKRRMVEKQKEAKLAALERMRRNQEAFATQFEDSTTGINSQDSMEQKNECAMCHAESDQLMCHIGFAQRSALLAQNYVSFDVVTHPKTRTYLAYPESRFQWRPVDTPFRLKTTKGTTAVYMNFCGHVVHFDCWASYHSSQFQHAITGGNTDGPQAVDVTKGEFLCPICKTISNLLVPYTEVSYEEVNPHCAESLPQTDTLLAMRQWREKLESKPIQKALPLPKVSRKWLDGLASACMSLHQVASGVMDRGRPDRYIKTAYSALSYTLCSNYSVQSEVSERDQDSTAKKEAEVLPYIVKAFSFIKALPCLQSEDPQQSMFLQNLLYNPIRFGGAPSKPNSIDGDSDEKHQTNVGQTPKLSIWNAVKFPRKPLLYDEMNDTMVSAILLSTTDRDCSMSIRYFVVARLLQLILGWSSMRSNSVSANRNPVVWMPQPVEGFKTSSAWSKGAQTLFDAFGGGDSCKIFLGDLCALQHFVARELNADMFLIENEVDCISMAEYVGMAITPSFELVRFIETALHESNNTAWKAPVMPTIKQVLVSPKAITVWLDRICHFYTDATDVHGALKEWTCINDLAIPTLVLHDLCYAVGWNGRFPSFPVLPEKYVALYAQLSKRKCRSCLKFPSRPAMCIVCGEVLCAGSSCTTRPSGPPGACTVHAKSCGNGIGIFFLVLEGSILLMHRARAAYSPSIYVDEYGEEFGERHKYMNRGRPLHLHKQRFHRLHYWWVTHQIPKQVVNIQNGNDRIIRNSHY